MQLFLGVTHLLSALKHLFRKISSFSQGKETQYKQAKLNSCQLICKHAEGSDLFGIDSSMFKMNIFMESEKCLYTFQTQTGVLKI